MPLPCLLAICVSGPAPYADLDSYPAPHASIDFNPRCSRF